MALHGKTHHGPEHHGFSGAVSLSTKAGLARKAFEESLHPRGAGGKFSDKPGAGADAPKKPRPAKTAAVAPATGSAAASLGAAKINATHAITVHVQGNPKKGTAAQRFALYKPGMTVAEYVAAVGDKKQALRDLAWDAKQGWISLAPPKAAAVAAAGGAQAAASAAGTAAVTLSLAKGEAAAAKVLLPKGHLDAPFDADAARNAWFKATDYSYEGFGPPGVSFDKFEDNLNDLAKRTNKGFAPSPNAEAAIEHYTAEDYGPLNHALRNDLELSPSQTTMRDHLDDVVLAGELPEDVKLHRIVYSDKFKAKLSGLTPGSVLVSPAFTSTGFNGGALDNIPDPTEGSDSPVFMRILGRKGAAGLALEPHTVNSGEHEFLIPRNAPLTYVGKIGETYLFEYKGVAPAVAKASLDDLPALKKLDDLPVPVQPESPAAKTGAAVGEVAPKTKGVLAFTGAAGERGSVNGVALAPWAAPKTQADWAAVAGQKPDLVEPELKNPKNLKISTGVIIHEPDGRVWVYEPKGHFGGYEHTFPKGGLEAGLSMQANAIKEAHEETGLKVRIVGFAGDHEGDTSVTRLYHAVREAGQPTAGDETAAVKLASPDELKTMLNKARDKKILAEHVLANNPMPDYFATGKLLAPTALPGLEGTGKAPIEAGSWKKTGPQLGSNPGGTYEAPDGQAYYVKQSKSAAHAENEILADEMYRLLGTGTLEPRAFTFQGKPATGSKILALDTFDPENSAHRAEVQKHFVAHAYLANWDAVGTGFDNQGLHGGKMLTLDGGGALKYRAQGGLKPNFGADVAELASLRDPNNYYAHKVFGEMTPAQIRESGKAVAGLTDSQIDAAVERSIKDPGSAAEYKKILKARRDDVALKLGLKQPPAGAEPVAPPPPSPPLPAAPATGTKSKVPLVSGVPVVASTNPDPLPLGAKLWPDTKIHLEVQGNPKKSTAALRFAKYEDGMTVSQYVAALGGDKQQAMKDLLWDVKQGWISFSAAKSGPKLAPPFVGPAETAKNADLFAKALNIAPPKPAAPTPAAPTLPAATPAAATPGQLVSQLQASTKSAKEFADAAEKAGVFAEKPVVVPTPSPSVLKEKPGQGTTAADPNSWEGFQHPYGVAESVAGGSVATSVIKLAAQPHMKSSKGIESKTFAAGAQMSAAASYQDAHPDSSKTTLLASAYNGSYDGALAISHDGDVATIQHFGTLNPGKGGVLLNAALDAVAAKGATRLEVKTASPQIYAAFGFKPTGTKDVYAIDLSAKAKQYAAANAAAGVPTPATEAAAAAAKSADAKATLALVAASDTPIKLKDGGLPTGYKVHLSPVSTVVTTAKGTQFDYPDSGGVAALDAKTQTGTIQGTHNKTSKLTTQQFVEGGDKLLSKIQELQARGQTDANLGYAAATKAFKIVQQSDDDPGDGTKLYGFSLNSKGEVKGAIAANTSKESKTVVVTDHAGLGGGSGTSALNQLIEKAQAEGKEQILVKSGLSAYYQAQGFSASLDHQGYLKLDVSPTKYGKVLDPPTYIENVKKGAYSTVATHLMEQIVKPSATPNAAAIDASVHKVYKIDKTDPEYVLYKKETYDSAPTNEQKAALVAFTRTSSDITGPYLQGKEPTEAALEKQKNIDAAIANTSFKEDHVLYRGMRGADVAGLFSHLSPGDVYRSKVPASYSTKPGSFYDPKSEGSYNQGVALRVFVKKGSKGAPVQDISKYPNEYETIFPSNAPLRFLGLTPQGTYDFEYA